LKYGITFGEIYFNSTDDGTKYYYGDPITSASNIQQYSKSGNLIVDQSIKIFFRENLVFRKIKKQDCYKIEYLAKKKDDEYSSSIINFDDNEGRNLELWNNQFKDITALFITTSNISEEQYNGFLNYSLSISKNYNLSKPRIYFSDKGCSMLFYSGINSDEISSEKGLSFSLELTNSILKQDLLKDIKLSIGISSSKVFLGEVGDKKSSDYICCGRAANLSARLSVYSKRLVEAKLKSIILCSFKKKNSL
jgi:hypothetical protein